jgi:putative tryptophan/tyrosine transport system substrate-binding protein
VRRREFIAGLGAVASSAPWPLAAHAQQSSKVYRIAWVDPSGPVSDIETDSFMAVHRGTVMRSATRNNVPAITDVAFFAREGGLISYGPNNRDLLRRAAGHVDRILRGTRPADLAVELPTKFEMVINLKAARTFGLTVPLTLQASADEVIE